MLKADLHIHTGEDPYDKIKYSSKELIDHAARLGFDVLAITNHHKIHYSKKLADYAKRKGILLISGVETHINGKEVLLLNARKPGRIKDFSDLERLKKENVVVIAPHAFYPLFSACLGEELLKNIKYFDAIEYCHFYLPFLNSFNKKAVMVAKKYNKTLVGTSDSHRLFQMGHTYSLIDCNKDIDSVLEAIRKGKVQIRTKCLSYFSFLRIFFKIFSTGISRKLNKIKFDNSYF
jgi:hypothetical protein